MTRRHNPIRIKADCSYTAAEIAMALDVRSHTVCRWVSKGLQPFDHHRPRLFYGREVQVFLRRFNKPREPLGPGEFYCVSCKGRRLPVRGEIWLTPRSERTADYTADCSGCGRRVFRRVRIADVHQKLGSARLVYKDGGAHISRESAALHMTSSEEPVA